MDLWDVIKLMARRWYVALPILILTAAGGLWTAVTVEPEYTATTNMILLPPVLRNEGGEGQRVNPWDTHSLTLATLSYANSKSLHDELKALGFSDVWAADMDQRSSSLIIIAVTASSPETATTTAEELQKRVVAEVQRRQAAYNLKSGEEITTIPFDNGSNLEPVTTKLKRTLIVVAGVGIIFTIGTTVGVDALLRRRAAKRARRGAAPYDMDYSPENPPIQRRDRAAPAAGSPARRSPTRPARAPGAMREPVLPQITVPAPAGGAGAKVVAPDAPATGVGFQTSGEPRSTAIEHNSPSEPAEDGEHTDTIILPLSNPGWAAKARERRDLGESPAENGKR